jgi:hypothetical protein
MNDKKRRSRRKANRGYEPKGGWQGPIPSAEAIARTKAWFDGGIARLRAKAAKGAALDAKEERLEREIQDLTFNLATLAARIHPELCESKPVEAIKLAIKLIRAIKAAEQDLEKEDRKAKAQAAKDELASLRVSYNEGVLFITGESKKPARAREYFERFLLWKYPTKAQANTALRRYEDQGFTGLEVAQLGKEFTAGWPFREEKGKQGQVKSPEKDARKKPKLAPLSRGVKDRLRDRSDNESG